MNYIFILKMEGVKKLSQKENKLKIYVLKIS